MYCFCAVIFQVERITFITFESLLVSVRLCSLQFFSSILPSLPPLLLTGSSAQDGSYYSLNTIRLHQALRQQQTTQASQPGRS